MPYAIEPGADPCDAAAAPPLAAGAHFGCGVDEWGQPQDNSSLAFQREENQ